MKTIATINTQLPTVNHHIEYLSGESLRDWDIAIFDPELPPLERIEFSGGGSCVAIEDTKRLRTAFTHWAEEIRSALQAGKTVFFLLNAIEQDTGATGSESKNRTQRTYITYQFHNYQALPFSLSLKNTKGRRISAVNSVYKPLLDTISDIASYKVIFSKPMGQPIFSTSDGAVVGSVVKHLDLSGHIVFLPHFDLSEFDKSSRSKWSAKATQLSHGIVAQLVAIDQGLRSLSVATPAPQWVSGARAPKAVRAIDAEIDDIHVKIADLNAFKEKRIEEKKQLLSFSRLLYENGKSLETAIEEALRLLGFDVENFCEGDLEIDHIIVGPSGFRMIGESEGKDRAAIDITKFRQLESNINEDFQRDIIEKPAKGILFGNGYRFTEPSERGEQFTAKCLTNAKRLQTALVKTSDLYDAVIYVLDNPEDEAFKASCRYVIENTSGEIVVFPKSDVTTTDSISDDPQT